MIATHTIMKIQNHIILSFYLLFDGAKVRNFLCATKFFKNYLQYFISLVSVQISMPTSLVMIGQTISSKYSIPMRR